VNKIDWSTLREELRQDISSTCVIDTRNCYSDELKAQETISDNFDVIVLIWLTTWAIPTHFNDFIRNKTNSWIPVFIIWSNY
jgi:hypothetical protein